MTSTIAPRKHLPGTHAGPTVTDTSVAATGIGIGSATAGRYVFGATRIALGSVFLWAFIDKTFGLGHATPSARSWLNGGSPTTGYLKGVEGPFAAQFNSLADNRLMDVLFMVALAGIGIALVLGIGMRIAAASSVALLGFMWAASLPITTHPFLDDHLVYAAVIVGFALTGVGSALGIGTWWSTKGPGYRFPVLR